MLVSGPAGNVLLRSSTEDKRGFVAKVADFGLARTMQPHDELHKVRKGFFMNDQKVESCQRKV